MFRANRQPNWLRQVVSEYIWSLIFTEEFIWFRVEAPRKLIFRIYPFFPTSLLNAFRKGPLFQEDKSDLVSASLKNDLKNENIDDGITQFWEELVHIFWNNLILMDCRLSGKCELSEFYAGLCGGESGRENRLCREYRVWGECRSLC